MPDIIYLTCRTLASTPCVNGYYHIAEVGWTRDNRHFAKADLTGMVDWLLADRLNNIAYSWAPTGQTARVHVLICGRHQYIESYSDHTQADNLRELPPCPRA